MEGFVSGVISSFVTHPLEFYKIKYQNGFDNSKINLSRGCIINPFTYGIHYAVYFPIYKKLKSNGLDSFSSGFLAQSVSSIFLNPLWIIRTQRIATNKTYREIYSTFNIKTCFRGITASGLICFQTALSMTFMESLLKNDNSLLISSFLAKTISGVITYPLDTFRTIIRTDNYKNPYKLFNELIFNPLRFYKGLSFYLLKSVPSFVIVNYCYSILKKN